MKGNRIENFTLEVDAATCKAPGYTQIFNTINAQDFEASDGAYVVSGFTTWAYGTPSSGPGYPHSGVNLWATNLTGEYVNNENGALTSPVFDLSPYAGRMVLLKWWEWLDTESGYDYGRVEISPDDGATWRELYAKSGHSTQQWIELAVVLAPGDLTAPAPYTLYLHFRLFGHLPRLVCG